MGVRVRVRIKVGGKAVDEIALVNSGFESDEPDIAVPVSVAQKLGV